MTRLESDWIRDICTDVREHESELLRKTGLDYISLASAAAELPVTTLVSAAKDHRIAVIPITTGLGIIGSFSQAVAEVLRCMGFDVFITGATDVDGIYEAYRNEAKILFLADDNRFIALNLISGKISENDTATARGYTAALEAAAGGLHGRDVLVLGCGRVGREALSFLKHKGANPVGYDINRTVLEQLTEQGYKTISDPNRIKSYSLILDANPAAEWIGQNLLHPDAIIAAPGIPLSLDEEAYAAFKDRVIHDYLPAGVAVMLAMALK